MLKLTSLLIAGVVLSSFVSCQSNSVESPSNVSTHNSQTRNAETKDGKDLTWTGNGLTWTIPVNWIVLLDRPNIFTFGDVKGTVLPGVCNAGLTQIGDQTQTKAVMDKNEQMFRGHVKDGSVSDLQSAAIAGFEGFEFVDTNSDGWRREHFLGTRKHNGQYQILDLICGNKEANFDANKATYYSVVHSMKGNK